MREIREKSFAENVFRGSHTPLSAHAVQIPMI